MQKKKKKLIAMILGLWETKLDWVGELLSTIIKLFTLEKTHTREGEYKVSSRIAMRRSFN